MEQNKKLTILLVLAIILGILVFTCYQKYKPSNEVNTYNKKADKEISQEEPQPELTEEEKILVNKLYNKVAVNSAATECLDYYMIDKITVDSMSDELKSYLLLKNMNVVPSPDAQPVEKEKIDNTLQDLFNRKEETNPTYIAKVGQSNFELRFDIDFNTYVISSTEADSYNHVLEREITDSTINDSNIEIKENFKLVNDGNNTIEGTLTYTFNKVNDNYYFASVERTLK